MASAVLSLLAIVAAVAAMPVLIGMFAVFMTKREYSEPIRHTKSIPTLWKIGTACFITYLIMFFVLKLLLAVENFNQNFNHFYFPALYRPQPGSFSSFANSLLYAMGIPIPFLFDAFARKIFEHLSAFHILLLYTANGILLSYLATSLYARLRKANGPHANKTTGRPQI